MAGPTAEHNIDLLFAGDAFVLTATANATLLALLGGSIAACEFTCTVRRYQNSTSALIVKRSDLGEITRSGESVRIEFVSADTVGWPMGKVHYDVQCVPSESKGYTLAGGTINVRKRITTSRSTQQVSGQATLAATVPVPTLAATLELNVGTLDATLPAVTLEAASIGASGEADILMPALTVVATGEASLASLGASLLHHWEPSAEAAMLDGSSNASQLLDRGAGAAHWAQATSGNRPSYNATGGPNSRPCITAQDVGRFLFNDTISHVAKYLGIYAIYKLQGGADTRVPFALMGPAQAYSVAAFYQSGSQVTVAAKEQGQSAQLLSLTTPALSTNWCKGSIEYLFAGLESRINGVVTNPDLSGSTRRADAVGYVRFGSATLAGGSLASLIVLDLELVPGGYQTVLNTYHSERFGL
jgi:hypothetical protein